MSGRGTVAVLVVAAFAMFAPSTLAQAREVSCGSVMDYYRGEYGTRQYVKASLITGIDVRCSTARKIARAFISRSHYPRVNRDGQRYVRNRWPKGAGRFSCSNERIGSDVRTVACRDGGEAVTFGWYDSSPYH
jgi:hypothetical protein